MAKTERQSYYELKFIEQKENRTKEGVLINEDVIEVERSKYLHFSMNCWVNLKQDTGKDIGTLFSEYDKADNVDQFITLCDIAYAALKANDQEEGNDIDYTIFNVRTWMEGLKEENAAGFIAAMTHSMNLPLGKEKAKK